MATYGELLGPVLTAEGVRNRGLGGELGRLVFLTLGDKTDIFPLGQFIADGGDVRSARITPNERVLDFWHTQLAALAEAGPGHKEFAVNYLFLQSEDNAGQVSGLPTLAERITAADDREYEEVCRTTSRFVAALLS